MTPHTIYIYILPNWSDNTHLLRNPPFTSTMTVTPPKLFAPIRVGDCTLQHRVVLAPLTRQRATKDHVPTDLQVEYYAQRGSTSGTLLITEGTFIAPQAGGFPHVPGIWNDDQVAGWKRVHHSHAHVPTAANI